MALTPTSTNNGIVLTELSVSRHRSPRYDLVHLDGRMKECRGALSFAPTQPKILCTS
jgi:hypothetical protein